MASEEDPDNCLELPIVTDGCAQSYTALLAEESALTGAECSESIASAKVAAGKKREETLNMKLDLAAAVQLWTSFCQEFATFGKSRKRIFAV